MKRNAEDGENAENGDFGFLFDALATASAFSAF